MFQTKVVEVRGGQLLVPSNLTLNVFLKVIPRSSSFF
ncbi:hypothetical protein TSAR_000997 [Trichomalopsis sarcophagae]|uniref:Uncharacterized protein n=1 Tax=Trichomalopsis sarcophagae TaxID=543379 RepID=A0A232FGL6_9HYME|nr:hypothetical protein TSAR_000997 [Trichomalopsis sarcophagae]